MQCSTPASVTAKFIELKSTIPDNERRSVGRLPYWAPVPHSGFPTLLHVQLSLHRSPYRSGHHRTFRLGPTNSNSLPLPRLQLHRLSLAHPSTSSAAEYISGVISVALHRLMTSNKKVGLSSFA